MIVQTQDGHDFEDEEVKAMDLVQERFEAPQIENSILEEFKEKVNTLTLFFLCIVVKKPILFPIKGK